MPSDESFIYGPLIDLSDGKTELKVRITKSTHTKLHSLKLLRGKSLSSMVEEAVLQYFKEQSA